MNPTTEKHIFAIDSDVLDTLTREEVEATANAMAKMGLYRQPYDRGVHVRIKPRALSKLMGEEPQIDPNDPNESQHVLEIPISLEYEDRSRKSGLVRDIFPAEKGWRPDPRKFKYGDVWDASRREMSALRYCDGTPLCLWDIMEAGFLLRQALAVILAARGYSKTETGRRTKLQKLQGKKEDGTVVTHIGIDPRLRIALGGSHASPRMHLRRGHIREHFYPSTGENKPIWIEATLICADADFMATRTAYTVH